MYTTCHVANYAAGIALKAEVCSDLPYGAAKRHSKQTGFDAGAVTNNGSLQMLPRPDCATLVGVRASGIYSKGEAAPTRGARYRRTYVGGHHNVS